jgi:SnoaL-like domain
MTREDVQSWLDAYVDAWRSYDPDAIGELFSEEAGYSYHPYDDPLVGRAAIVESWRAERDPPDSWEAAYRPLLVDGERAIATGETRYANGDIYANLWELEFDDGGRCTKFVEWFMKHPRAAEPGTGPPPSA